MSRITLPSILVLWQVAFDADQSPHLHTKSHCLTHAYETQMFKPQKHSHSNKLTLKN